MKKRALYIIMACSGLALLLSHGPYALLLVAFVVGFLVAQTEYAPVLLLLLLGGLFLSIPLELQNVQPHFWAGILGTAVGVYALDTYT